MPDPRFQFSAPAHFSDNELCLRGCIRKTIRLYALFITQEVLIIRQVEEEAHWHNVLDDY